jgi:hypothetical protein
MSSRIIVSLTGESLRQLVWQKRSIVVALVLCLASLIKVNTLALYTVSHGQEYSLYDWILFHTDHFNTVMFIFSPMYLFLVSWSTSRGQEYLSLIRCNHRVEWYLSKGMAILLSACLYVFLILLITCLIGLRTFSFQDGWSDAANQLSRDPEMAMAFGFAYPAEMLAILSPMQAVIVSSLYLTAFLIFLGFVVFTVHVFIQSRQSGFIAGMLVLTFCTTVYKSEWVQLYFLSPYNHALLFMHDFGSRPELPDLYSSMWYWGVVPLIVFLLGYYRFRRVNLIERARRI